MLLKISTHLLARLGWFCPVASEPVKPYFTRFLRVLTFCLVKNRHFLKKWCSKWCSKRGKIDRCFLNVELWDKVVNGIII